MKPSFSKVFATNPYGQLRLRWLPPHRQRLHLKLRKSYLRGVRQVVPPEESGPTWSGRSLTSDREPCMRRPSLGGRCPLVSSNHFTAWPT